MKSDSPSPTAGDWSIVADNDKRPEHRYTVMTDTCKSICDVYSQKWEKNGKVLTDPEALANARLISAAPKLLAVVQKLFNEVNGLNATRRATDLTYRTSSLCEALNNLVRDSADIIHKLNA